jgi:hypothetical protein
MNTETDTPRTDEAWAAWPYAGSGMSVHVGRQLERELNAVTEQRDEALSDLEFRRDLFKLQEQQLNDVRAERDRLAEAIITHRAKAFPLNGEDYDLELWQALQSLTTNAKTLP